MLAPSLRRLIVKLVTITFILAVFVEGRPSSDSANNVAANHEDPKVHCEPTNWYDICWFIFANYILHALSVRSLPGENSYSSFVIKIGSLFIPFTGLRRGLCLIIRAATAADNDLQAAARARALCMVIRKPDWRPCAGDVIEGCELDVHEDVADNLGVNINTDSKNCNADNRKVDNRGSSNEIADVRDEKGLTLQLKDPYTDPLRHGSMELMIKWLIETPHFRCWSPSASIVDHESFKIHGRCQLAEGYALSYVPGDMKVHARIPSSSGNASTETSAQTRLACVHDFPRILFSLTQTISGAYALYKARGSQIERYGYAAFGLTVIPYIVISIINFIGSLLSSEYETIFLVHSSIMDEMIARGGFSDGTVGSVCERVEDETHTPLLDREANIDSRGSALKFEGSEDLLRCVNSSNHSFKIEPLSEKSTPKRWCFRWKSRYHGLVQYPVLARNPTITTKDTTLSQATSPKPKAAKQRRRRLWPWRKPSAPANDKVSTISIPSHPPFTRLPPVRHQTSLNLLAIILFIMANATPYLVIGLLSGFKPNKSTSLQRNFTLTWLICGQSQGYGLGESVEQQTRKKAALWGILIIFVCYGAYSVCGFFVVAQEMLEFGTCKAM
ncbi:hypothetical protein MMC31_001493 [Peltigera leucophlebia]|nr:hypothetical protein [Peltigera leucophlebia]